MGESEPLIAELLAALLSARDEIDWWAGEHGCCAGAQADTMRTLKAAIAKAEEALSPSGER